MKFADFHAARHTFITNLSRSGVYPKTAQDLARHSDIRLTMNVYSHTDLSEQAKAVGRLPTLVRRRAPRSSALPTEHDDDERGQRLGSARESQSDSNGRKAAREGGRVNQVEVRRHASQVKSTSSDSATRQQVWREKQSTPERIRRMSENLEKNRRLLQVAGQRVGQTLIVTACSRKLKMTRTCSD
ncbi:MAG: tyrosine-type recombinase/integrase [Planctomycetales bacterium]|nr:tyrosine-type recombinase/integrase [Planctomycetales bacterium]